MTKKNKERPRVGQAEIHVQESFAWAVMLKKFADRREATEEFLAITMLGPPNEGFGIAGNVRAKGYG